MVPEAPTCLHLSAISSAAHRPIAACPTRDGCPLAAALTPMLRYIYNLILLTYNLTQPNTIDPRRGLIPPHRIHAREAKTIASPLPAQRRHPHSTDRNRKRRRAHTRQAPRATKLRDPADGSSPAAHPVLRKAAPGAAGQQLSEPDLTHLSAQRRKRR